MHKLCKNIRVVFGDFGRKRFDRNMPSNGFQSRATLSSPQRGIGQANASQCFGPHNCWQRQFLLPRQISTWLPRQRPLEFDQGRCIDYETQGFLGGRSARFTASKSSANLGSAGNFLHSSHNSRNVIVRAPGRGPRAATGLSFLCKIKLSPVCLILARQSPRFLAASVVDMRLDMRRSVIYKKADVNGSVSLRQAIICTCAQRISSSPLIGKTSGSISLCIQDAFSHAFALAWNLGNAY